MANERDVAGFEQVYGEHSSPIRNFLRVYLRDDGAADDLTQETFLQIWRRPAGFDPKRSTMRAYLLGIARKKALDWWRRRKSDALTTERVELPLDSSALLTDALAQLEAELRNILWLREVEGYSYHELAGILGVPLGTVKSRLFKAREQLRKVWSQEEKQ